MSLLLNYKLQMVETTFALLTTEYIVPSTISGV